MPNGMPNGMPYDRVAGSAASSQETHGECRYITSVEWWVRVLDDDLTEAERLQWEAHLQGCERCRDEWARLSRTDAFLSRAPEPPALPADFTAVTVQAIVRRQRRWRYLSFLAGFVIVAVVAVTLLVVMGAKLTSLSQEIGAIVSARQALFHALVQTFLALIVRWRVALPFIMGGVVLAYVLMMPNGLLMTFAVVWLSGHRPAQVSSRAAPSR